MRKSLEIRVSEMVAGEVNNILKVSTCVALLMAYARTASSRTPPGRRRLLALFPIIAILPFLPCTFTTLHLRGISSFFLTWLAVFKLLLLSFDLGPLSPSLPLTTFISIASLPVKPATHYDSHSTTTTQPPTLRVIPSAVRAALLVALIALYSYRHRIPHYLLLVLFCFHIYLALELILAVAATLARALLKMEFEPQFNEPYRSVSLQDFWGRRWNLMVTGILRPTVYLPVRKHLGSDAGVMATFLVSGVMHEVIFCYLTCAAPTGEVVGFFVLHGLCTAAEVKAKKAGWGLRLAVAGPVALVFVMVSSFWLFYPPMLRNGVWERAMEESTAIVGFLEDSSRTVVGWVRYGVQ